MFPTSSLWLSAPSDISASLASRRLLNRSSCSSPWFDALLSSISSTIYFLLKQVVQHKDDKLDRKQTSSSLNASRISLRRRVKPIAHEGIAAFIATLWATTCSAAFIVIWWPGGMTESSSHETRCPNPYIYQIQKLRWYAGVKDPPATLMTKSASWLFTVSKHGIHGIARDWPAK